MCRTGSDGVNHFDIEPQPRRVCQGADLFQMFRSEDLPAIFRQLFDQPAKARIPTDLPPQIGVWKVVSEILFENINIHQACRLKQRPALLLIQITPTIVQ